MKSIEKVFTPRVRKWIYRVSLAVLPILTAAGIISDDTAPLIASLIGAVLVVGMADANLEKAPDYIVVEELDTVTEENFRDTMENPFDEVMGDEW